MGLKREVLAPLTQFNGASGGVENWQYKQLELHPNAVTTLTFLDSKPKNMFFLQNDSGTDLFISFANYPTLRSYQFCVTSNTSKTFGRPIPVNELYILNPSNERVKVDIFSGFGDFDISSISDVSINIGDALVQLSDGLESLKKSDVISDVISLNKTNITSSDTYDFEGLINSYGFCPDKILLISNDGENDINISYTKDGTNYTDFFTLKKGEVLTDIKMSFTGLTFSPVTSDKPISYRLMLTKGGD